MGSMAGFNVNAAPDAPPHTEFSVSCKTFDGRRIDIIRNPDWIMVNVDGNGDSLHNGIRMSMPQFEVFSILMLVTEQIVKVDGFVKTTPQPVAAPEWHEYDEED